MTVGSIAVSNATTFEYIPFANDYRDWQGGNGLSAHLAKGLYSAALLTPAQTKASPVDLWTNFKVSMLEDLPDCNGESEAPSSWFAIPADNVTYTSVVGTPLSGVNASSGTTSFRLETSYWRLQCSLVQLGNACDKFEDDERAQCVVADGFDWSGFDSDSSTLMSNGSSEYICNRGEDALDVPPRNLIYSAWASRNLEIDTHSKPFTTHCTIKTSWVELDVRCQARDCLMDRMRRSQLPHAPPGWTLLDDLECTNWGYFSQWFVRVLAASRGATGTLPQGYLADPSDRLWPNTRTAR